ncbi:zinc finger CCCH domain-containing protein 18 [Eutrema salsugineum]|uniref:zinc finger CCCH domain-containing protein 18 n=1 Tax=Eutrema salsugineum TaxID=72664 RepID=UPI000CED6F16|nr:zinc finger CCCH domain-containing protein 18 [Eutrema salsugineum]
MEEEEGVESRRSRKEQERERRRLRDRERRQSMSKDERERHLARRRKNYQLRRQRAEISRIDSQIQAITGGGSQSAMTSSPPDSGASSSVPLVESDQSVGLQVEDLAKLMGTIRLSRMKHLARTLRKPNSTGAEASNSGATYAKSTRRAMSSGLRLSRVKRMVRSKGQHEGLLSQHSQTQVSTGLQLQ